MVCTLRPFGSGACSTVLFDTNALSQKNDTFESCSGVRSGVSVEFSWLTMRCVEFAPISVRSRPSGDVSTDTLAQTPPASLLLDDGEEEEEEKEEGGGQRL